MHGSRKEETVWGNETELTELQLYCYCCSVSIFRETFILHYEIYWWWSRLFKILTPKFVVILKFKLVYQIPLYACQSQITKKMKKLQFCNFCRKVSIQKHLIYFCNIKLFTKSVTNCWFFSSCSLFDTLIVKQSTPVVRLATLSHPSTSFCGWGLNALLDKKLKKQKYQKV